MLNASESPSYQIRGKMSILPQTTLDERQKWLYEHAGKLFDHYLVDSVTDLGDA